MHRVAELGANRRTDDKTDRTAGDRADDGAGADADVFFLAGVCRQRRHGNEGRDRDNCNRVTHGDSSVEKHCLRK